MKQKSTIAVFISLLVLLSLVGASAGFAAPTGGIDQTNNTSS